ncbi:MFS transporter [Cryobacterium psychrophilum]|uniref:MFS transporter n=1 Tax=Cryobacterium psychrophilum TaxID=41988 RepID=A0A4Y8KNC0_9MICO|nr:MFS transporter [Cryobacterium psychrophilum]TDW29104.1 CP family cyanate transporter-like MFS transporter [Cryobacterium psychrophilum]TFD79687.1 MFS transporter [Cryobacterium psychrophilum]
MSARRRVFYGRTLAFVGILLVAANLRTAVAALSPIASRIDADISLSVATLGVLGMLPPVCFAVFGIVAPVFTRRIGLEGLLIVSLLAILFGHLARGLSVSLMGLLLGSALTFAGLGIGNVLLPPLVKKYFPDRVGLLTSLYVTLMALSTLFPALVAVPVANAVGWRTSLGMWMVLALVALVPWTTMLVRHRTRSAPTPVIDEADPVVLGRIWRSSVAWAIAAIFAIAAVNAYSFFAWLPQLLRDTAGMSAAQAGTLLAVYAGMGVPGAFLIPVLAARMKNIGRLVYLGVGFFIAGDLGLLLAPETLTWLWVVFAGLGPLLFPLALVLINLRTRTRTGSVALSGFVQSVGYTIGALGPLLFGLLHSVTGGWTWPLLVLVAMAGVVPVAAAVISRPHMLEDDLNRSR